MRSTLAIMAIELAKIALASTCFQSQISQRFLTTNPSTGATSQVRLVLRQKQIDGSPVHLLNPRPTHPLTPPPPARRKNTDFMSFYTQGLKTFLLEVPW
jgi:hypothetical protein